VRSPEEKALRDEIRRLWLRHWELLEEQQSLVAEHGMLLERHARQVERLWHRPELIKEHRAWAQRHAEMRARLARHMDEFLWGAPQQ
jgi:hypothetical protein